MKTHRIPRVESEPLGLGSSCSKFRPMGCQVERSDEGFTLVELLIVVTILPLIIGALSIGLISVFSLQSGVSSRLGDTADSQVVAANFQSDVQRALSITTSSVNNQGQCGPGAQLLGLAWGTPVGPSSPYQYVVSYVVVTRGSSNSLIRQYCSNGYSTTATSSTTISYDVPSTLTNPTVSTASGAPDPSQAWVSTQQVSSVVFPILEPNSNFSYTLAAVPAASSSAAPQGEPLVNPATAGCGFATPGTGKYASTLCLVDFSALTNNNNMLAATTSCLEMAVPLPGGYEMYFCIKITGVAVRPSPLPTWENAFLGNSCVGSTDCSTGTPFYTGIPGDPALYQKGAGTTTITITGITVISPLGTPATGWEVVAADAESTDASESISWTASWPATWSGSKNLNILNNGETYDTLSDPVGNACSSVVNGVVVSGAGLTTSNNGQTVTCAVPSSVSIGLKTGAAMVWATSPSSLTMTLVGNGLEAIAFGLLLS